MDDLFTLADALTMWSGTLLIVGYSRSWDWTLLFFVNSLAFSLVSFSKIIMEHVVYTICCSYVVNQCSFKGLVVSIRGGTTSTQDSGVKVSEYEPHATTPPCSTLSSPWKVRVMLNCRHWLTGLSRL